MHDERFIEQVTAQLGCCSPLQSPEGETTASHDKTSAEQATAPTLPADDTPQEDSAVAVETFSEADLDDLFEDDEAEQGLTTAVSEESTAPAPEEAQVTEGLLAAVSEETTVSGSQEPGDLTPSTSQDTATDTADSLPGPLSEEEFEVLTTQRTELTASHAQISKTLEQGNDDIAKLEKEIQDLVCWGGKNVLFKRRSEGLLSGKSASLSVLRSKIELQEKELAAVEQEIAALPAV